MLLVARMFNSWAGPRFCLPGSYISPALFGDGDLFHEGMWSPFITTKKFFKLYIGQKSKGPPFRIFLSKEKFK